MWKNYFKIAWRSLGNQKGYSITNLVGLAMAVTAVLLISLWIQNELRYDNYYPDAERIYLIKNTRQYDNGNKSVTDYSPHAAVHHLEQENDNIEAVAYAIRSIPLDIMHQQEIYDEPKALYISDRWFDVFHYDFINGSKKAFYDHIRSLIITESKALQYFGSTDVVGKTLKIDSTDYAVQAVIKDVPSNSSMPFDILMPFEDPTIYGGTSDWTNFTTQIFVRLKAGSDHLQTTRLVQRLFENNIQFVQQGINIKCQLLPLRKLHFDQELSATAFQLGNLQTVFIFSGFVVLLLIIASINYVNISIARALSRSREIGTRKVVGATKWQLFLQMMVEAFLNSTLSLIVALLVVYLLLPYFNNFFDISLGISLVNTHIAVLVCCIWSAMVLLTGVYPAVYLSSFNPINLFRGTGAFQYGGRNTRRALLVGQFVLAIFMVIAGITMYNQMAYVQHKDTAYNRSQVFTMDIPSVKVADVPVDPQEDWETFSSIREQMEARILQTVKQELLIHAPIKNVSIITPSTVLNENHTMVGLLDWPGKDPNFQPQYGKWSVDEDFAKVLGLNMVKGRWFLKGDNTDYGNIILNETAVRDFSIPEPVIGQAFNFNGKQGSIVGVVKDFHFQDMRQKIGPLVISKKPYWGQTVMVQTQPSAIREALSIVEATFKRHFPGKAFTYKFIDEEFDQLYRKDQQTLVVALSFSVISIVLSFVGLLGMVFFDIQQRIKEIGIRKVMGASEAGIVGMLSADFIKLVFVAILIASPIAWWAMNRWLADFAYRIDLEWWMFGLAGLMAVLIALLTVSFQAVRAAVANPVESLRSE